MSEPKDWREALWYLEGLASHSKAPPERIREYADMVAEVLIAAESLTLAELDRASALQDANEQRHHEAERWRERVRHQYRQGVSVTALAERHGCNRSTIYRAVLADVAGRTACDETTIEGNHDA